MKFHSFRLTKFWQGFQGFKNKLDVHVERYKDVINEYPEELAAPLAVARAAIAKLQQNIEEIRQRD